MRLLLVLGALLAVAGCAHSNGSMATSTSSASSATSSPAPAPAPVTATTAPAPTDNANAAGDAAAPVAKPHHLASGLVYEDLIVGNGKMADPGLTVVVHYTGWLTDGTKFQSSLDSGQPYTFVLGTGNVIAGWDEGIKGMRIGGKRKLTIPPDLAYGAAGRPPVIPANSTLVFEVQLLNIK